MDENLNEEYIGRLPEFVEVTQLFDKMVERAKRVPNKMNPNTFPENTKICQILKKFFGFKTFNLYWIPSDIRNAFTFTDALLLGDDLDEVIVRAKRRHGRGFYDTDHSLSVIVFGYCGILRPEMNVTGAELTAIFLHEIGHNFDYSINNYCLALRRLFLRTAKKQYARKLSMVQGDPGDIDDDGRRTKMTYDEMKSYIYDTYVANGEFVYDHQVARNSERKQDTERLKRLFSVGQQFVGGIILTCSNIIGITTGLGILIQCMNIVGRRGEQFADSMAAAYGYSAELVSGLEKLGSYKELIVENHVPAKIIRDWFNVNCELNNLMGEVHASNQARAKDCILKLEADLRSGDYPPDMKKALQDDLKRLNEEYQEIVNCTPELRHSMQRGFRRLVDKVFGGRMEINKFFKPYQM